MEAISTVWSSLGKFWTILFNFSMACYLNITTNCNCHRCAWCCWTRTTLWTSHSLLLSHRSNIVCVHSPREEFPSLLGHTWHLKCSIWWEGSTFEAVYDCLCYLAKAATTSGSPVDAQEQHTLPVWNVTGHSRVPLHGAGLKESPDWLSQAQLYTEMKGKQDAINNKKAFLHTNVLPGGCGWVNDLWNSLKARCHKECIRYRKEQCSTVPTKADSAVKNAVPQEEYQNQLETNGRVQWDLTSVQLHQLNSATAMKAQWCGYTTPSTCDGISAQSCPWLHISAGISSYWLTYRYFSRLFARLFIH